MITFTTTEGWEVTVDEAARVVKCIDFKPDNHAVYCHLKGDWCYAATNGTTDSNLDPLLVGTDHPWVDPVHLVDEAKARG